MASFNAFLQTAITQLISRGQGCDTASKVVLGNPDGAILQVQTAAQEVGQVLSEVVGFINATEKG
jgi:hypothetical protein